MIAIRQPSEIRINGRRFENLSSRLRYLLARRRFYSLTEKEKSELKLLLDLAERGKLEGGK